MRELMIRFSKEGEYFREIDEERNYFLSEVEVIIESIRKRLEKEKRIVNPKGFECWIDGQKLIVAYVPFDKKERLENQLKNAMLTFNEWSDEIRHKYINLLTEYAETERRLFMNKEFSTFVVRFDQLLGVSNLKPFPLLLSVQKMKHLFDEVSIHVTSGFYSELEEIVLNIEASYQAHAEIIERQMLGNKKLEQTKRFNYFKLALEELFADEERFKEFAFYVGASYQSVPKNRMPALCARFRPYQEYQSYLFKHIVQTIDFSKVLLLQEQLLEALDKKYDEIMSKGFALVTEEMVESLVISPVISKKESELLTLVKKLELEKQVHQAKEGEENEEGDESTSEETTFI